MNTRKVLKQINGIRSELNHFIDNPETHKCGTHLPDAKQARLRLGWIEDFVYRVIYDRS